MKSARGSDAAVTRMVRYQNTKDYESCRDTVSSDWHEAVTTGPATHCCTGDLFEASTDEEKKLASLDLPILEISKTGKSRTNCTTSQLRIEVLRLMLQVFNIHLKSIDANVNR